MNNKSFDLVRSLVTKFCFAFIKRAFRDLLGACDRVLCQKELSRASVTSEFHDASLEIKMGLSWRKSTKHEPHGEIGQIVADMDCRSLSGRSMPWKHSAACRCFALTRQAGNGDG